MKGYPPLPISEAAKRLHDGELLAKIDAQSRPPTFAELFAGFSPRWAVDAMDRLLIRGEVWEHPDGRLALTELGRRSLARSAVPVDNGRLTADGTRARNRFALSPARPRTPHPA